MPPTMPYTIPRGQQGQAQAAQPPTSLSWGPAVPAVDPGAGAQLRHPQRTVGRTWESGDLLIEGTDARHSLPKGVGFRGDPKGEGWPRPW